ncbi:MAG: hypothetical protein N4A74_11635 [Carboxylicivirga sp.]|jgi:hypothetical protein|nr:hypothetical protein [Carboxylicivirga sp.]
MADAFEKLKQGNIYHIYNRGINSCDLLSDEEDYKHFLKLYERFIHPVADTFAWVLMPNHLHLSVRIKENVVYKYSMEEIVNAKNAVGLEINKWETIYHPDGVKDTSGLEGSGGIPTEKGYDTNISSATTLSGSGTKTDIPANAVRPKGADRRPSPTKHFSHLFNAYAKYHNAKYNRHGALFERPFKRKIIDSDDYMRQLIIYIHNNPKHHRFVSAPIEYPWSSYLDYLEGENEIYKACIEDYFGDVDNFKDCHQNKGDDLIFLD